MMIDGGVGGAGENSSGAHLLRHLSRVVEDDDPTRVMRTHGDMMPVLVLQAARQPAPPHPGERAVATNCFWQRSRTHPGLVAPDVLLIMHGWAIIVHGAVWVLDVVWSEDRLQSTADGRREDHVREIRDGWKDPAGIGLWLNLAAVEPVMTLLPQADMPFRRHISHRKRHVAVLDVALHLVVAEELWRSPGVDRSGRLAGAVW